MTSEAKELRSQKEKTLGREWELGLVCVMKKKIGFFFFLKNKKCQGQKIVGPVLELTLPKC